MGSLLVAQEKKPKLIESAAKQLKTPLLVGAGIHTKEDTKTALELGAKGILISSAIVKAKDQRKAIKGLL